LLETAYPSTGIPIITAYVSGAKFSNTQWARALVIRHADALCFGLVEGSRVAGRNTELLVVPSSAMAQRILSRTLDWPDMPGELPLLG
jgi:hypothetical protein